MAASFPGSVKTFATRSNAQVIDASHVNDLQDEVNAIEDGLINGSAPINSSRNTLAALSVSGGSTLATLSVSGGSTLATLTVSSNVTVSGELFVTTAPPAARVTNSAAVPIAADAATGLSFDTQRWATTGMHSTATNSSRLVAVSTGIWAIAAHVELSSGTLGQRDVRVVLNDVTTIGIGRVYSSSPVLVPVATTYRMTSTADYVTVQVFFGTSTGRVLQNANFTPEFMMTKIR